MPAIRPIAFAAVAILIVGGIWLNQPDNVSSKTYRTDIGQLRTVQLPDGSTVQLDTDTEVFTYYSKASRLIELVKGRAIFSVVHNSTSPFTVIAGQTVVRALGTEFDVFKENEKDITVTVLEGRVQVSQNVILDKTMPTLALHINEKNFDQPKVTSTIKSGEEYRPPVEVISSGQEVTVSEGKSTYEVKKANIKNIDERRNGRFYFKNKPLAEVILELNRYLETKIVIGDKRLNNILITINFNISARKYFLETLQKSVPIETLRNNDGQIIILKAGTVL